MNSTIPKAYLNVNPRTNFAEVYGKKLVYFSRFTNFCNCDSRLIYPHTCPFNGDRNDSCHCSEDGDASAGLTRFNKVRIDLLNRKFHRK